MGHHEVHRPIPQVPSYCPWSWNVLHYTIPMGANQLSMGMYKRLCDIPWAACIAHGLHETWTRTIPLGCNLGEGDIMRVTDPSHRCLHTAHGPGMCCTTLFLWVHISCPWVCTNIYVISHGVLCLAHGLHETGTRTIPWRCNLYEWDIMRCTDPSQGMVLAHVS